MCGGRVSVLNDIVQIRHVSLSKQRFLRVQSVDNRQIFKFNVRLNFQISLASIRIFKDFVLSDDVSNDSREKFSHAWNEFKQVKLKNNCII